MQTDWTIYLSFVGAGLIMLLPREAKSLIRWTALAFGVAGLAVAGFGYFQYNATFAAHIRNTGSGFVHIVNQPWIPSLGVSYHLALDGINFPLVLLNGFVCVTGILFSWNIEDRVKEFFAFFLTLIGGVYGVFMAMDLFLLFVFYELAIIPKYFIIAIWGSTRKEYGAMKLVLYSFAGPKHTFCIMFSRNTAVTTKPIMHRLASAGKIGNAPLKIMNSPTNPFSPGNPRDENMEMPRMPA